MMPNAFGNSALLDLYFIYSFMKEYMNPPIKIIENELEEYVKFV